MPIWCWTQSVKEEIFWFILYNGTSHYRKFSCSVWNFLFLNYRLSWRICQQGLKNVLFSIQQRRHTMHRSVLPVLPWWLTQICKVWKMTTFSSNIIPKAVVWFHSGKVTVECNCISYQPFTPLGNAANLFRFEAGRSCFHLDCV